MTLGNFYKYNMEKAPLGYDPIVGFRTLSVTTQCHKNICFTCIFLNEAGCCIYSHVLNVRSKKQFMALLL